MADEDDLECPLRDKVFSFLQREPQKTDEELALGTLIGLHFASRLFADGALCWSSDRGDSFEICSNPNRIAETSSPTICRALIVALRSKADFLQDMIDDPEDDGWYREYFEADIKAARSLADRLEILGG